MVNIEKRKHIRLNTKNSIKINSARMDLILKAAELSGVSLSEFVKMAALKEARLTILEFREDRIEVAKEILKKEEEKHKENGS
jgi:uncharacterized protein (DUF1778 family)